MQYAAYVGNVLSGDFGRSYLSGEPVIGLVAERVPATALLAFLSIVFALALSVPLGVLAALHPNSLLDRLALSLAVFGQAIPNFWAGLLLILVFGLNLGWLPISGSSSLAHFVLPSITLGTFAMAEAASIGVDWGYGAVNINVGCPSDRVQSGRFGACLMAEPETVAACVTAMVAPRL